MEVLICQSQGTKKQTTKVEGKRQIINGDKSGN